MRAVPFILLLSLVVACEGPVGPQGERGPDGEPGPVGPPGAPVVVTRTTAPWSPCFSPSPTLAVPELTAEILSGGVVLVYINDGGSAWVQLPYLFHDGLSVQIQFVARVGTLDLVASGEGRCAGIVNFENGLTVRIVLFAP